MERYEGCATTPISFSIWSRKMVAEVYGSKFLTTKPIDSSKQLKKVDSQLLQKAAVPEPTVMHGSADLSSTSGLSPSASSCDTQSEHKIDDTDDGLSMMASEIQVMVLLLL